MSDAETESYTRLTVNLMESAAGALRDASKWTGHSRTDTVNRALLLYAAIAVGVDDGTESLTYERRPDETRVQLVLPAGLRRLMRRLRVAYGLAWAAVIASLVAILLWMAD